MYKSDRNRIRRPAAATQADPHLVLIAIALLTVFSILQIDLHRDALVKLGVMISHEQMDARFLGP